MDQPALASVLVPPGTPASWQTLFWTLVPLAISSMAQPGGKICGLPARYRTYLRCSPLLCGADSLSIIGRLMINIIYLKQPFREALATMLHERFSIHNTIDAGTTPTANALVTEIHEDGGEGIQSLEKMTYLRWIWFILGTLPPAIKLVSMRGVPWEQAWGLMFLTSWIINEALIIFAAMNQDFFTFSDDGNISWPGYEQTTRSAQYKRTRRYFSWWEKRLAIVALVVHSVIVNGVFRVLWRQRWISYSVGNHILDVPGPVYTTIVSIGALLGIGLLSLFPRLRHLHLSYLTSLLTSTLFSLDIFLVCTALNIGWDYPLSAVIQAEFTQGAESRTRKLAWDWVMSSSATYIFLISATSISGILTTVSFLARQSAMLGKNLQVLRPNGIERQPVVDHGAIQALLFFYSTLIATVLWYANVYNPFGTFNPTWTGIFG